MAYPLIPQDSVGWISGVGTIGVDRVAPDVGRSPLRELADTSGGPE